MEIFHRFTALFFFCTALMYVFETGTYEQGLAAAVILTCAVEIGAAAGWMWRNG